jgi:hypothetical protein
MASATPEPIPSLFEGKFETNPFSLKQAPPQPSFSLVAEPAPVVTQFRKPTLQEICETCHLLTHYSKIWDDAINEYLKQVASDLKFHEEVRKGEKEGTHNYHAAVYWCNFVSAQQKQLRVCQKQMQWLKKRPYW